VEEISPFFIFIVFIIKYYIMKNKFILTEEESKRILSLHSKKIQEERVQGSKNVINEADPRMNAKNAIVGATLASPLIAPLAAINPLLGLAGVVIGGWLGATYSSGKAFDRVKNLLNACNTKKSKIGKTTLPTSRIKEIADSLNKAISGLGTNEELIKANLASIPTFPDLCAVNYSYSMRQSETLFDAIDGDIDSDSEWNEYVWKPIYGLIKKTKTVSENEVLKNAKACGYNTVEEYRNAKWKCKTENQQTNEDPEKTEKAKNCGHASWDEYKASGWKCNVKQKVRQKIRRGTSSETYPFNFDEVMKAIDNTGKCSATQPTPTPTPEVDRTINKDVYQTLIA
jgi:hypothetical protein